MNYLTTIFWVSMQAVALLGIVAVDDRTGFFSGLAPVSVWGIFCVMIVLANLTWMIVTIVYGTPGTLPSGTGTKRTVAAWLFPPPPASKRATYATRQRKVVP